LSPFFFFKKTMRVHEAKGQAEVTSCNCRLHFTRKYRYLAPLWPPCRKKGYTWIVTPWI